MQGETNMGEQAQIEAEEIGRKRQIKQPHADLKIEDPEKFLLCWQDKASSNQNRLFFKTEDTAMEWMEKKVKEVITHAGINQGYKPDGFPQIFAPGFHPDKPEVEKFSNAEKQIKEQQKRIDSMEEQIKMLLERDQGGKTTKKSKKGLDEPPFDIEPAQP